MDDAAPMNEGHYEIDGWHCVVAEWRQLVPDLDWNSPQVNGLVRAIEMWGERLVALRLTQDDETRRRAHIEKEKRYLSL